MIRPATPDDAQGVADIYNHYIDNTVVTFEEVRVTTEQMAQRIQAVLDQELIWLVAAEQGGLVGYAYASPWHARAAYRYSVEISAYLAPDAVGAGLGSKLYSALLQELKNTSIHSVIGGIALPNAASVALHEKYGLQKAAHYKEVGYKFGQWIDVGYWQMLIDEQDK